MTIENLDLADPLMVEIRELSRTATGHHLAPHMLGDRPLTRASALMVRRRLADKQPAQTTEPSMPERSVQFVTPSGRKRPSFQELADQVPQGYYAVPSATGHNDLDFYWVKDGKGKWVGRRFVKRIIGGHDPLQMSGPEQYRALAQIVETGVDKAGDKYADEMVACRDCNSPLTDEESRARRRGPTCASRVK